MTTPGDESRPNKVQPSHLDPAAEGRHQGEKPARATRRRIRQKVRARLSIASSKDANDETERARKALQEQVEEDAELLQRGSA